MANGKICIAMHPNGYPCTLVASLDSNWCPLHEEQQAKTLKAYKRYSGALSAFDDSQLCESPAAIAKCSTLQILIDWQSAAREKWALADRVIDARAKHHQRFYRGGDKNHHIFIQTLEVTKRELEQQCTLLDARAYKLVLEKQAANWLLVQDKQREICEEEPADVKLPTAEASPIKASTSSERRPSAASTDSGSSNSPSSNASTAPTDLDVETLKLDEPPALTETETHLARLHSHFSICRCEADLRDDRLLVVDHLFRFVVARSPSLLIRAHAYGSPHEFLAGGDLSLAELRTLDKGLRFDASGMLDPHVLRGAITAIHRRPLDHPEDRVAVLGGHVWRRAPKRAMTLDEWSHFHSFISCSGCALKVTRAFDEWLLCRTESHPGGRLPRYSDSSIPDSDVDLALARFGVLVARYSTDGKRTLERVMPKARNLKPVYVERDSRCWLYLRMSRTDVDTAERRLAALAADRRFDVLGPSETARRPWTTRLRSGVSPAARRAARWTDDRHFAAPQAFEVLAQDRFVAETVDAIVLSKLAPPEERIADFAGAVLEVVRRVSSM